MKVTKTGEGYAAIFLGFVLLWPAALEDHQYFYWIVGANVAVFGLTAFMSSMKDLGLFRGVTVIADSFECGFVNFTMFYVFFVLAAAYAIAVLNSVVGVLAGKSYSEEAWFNLVKRLIERKWLRR